MSRHICWLLPVHIRLLSLVQLAFSLMSIKYLEQYVNIEPDLSTKM